MKEKDYKYVVIEQTLRSNEELFKYQEDDEDVDGFKCFETFADAKMFYLECLDEKVRKALNLKRSEVK